MRKTLFFMFALVCAVTVPRTAPCNIDNFIKLHELKTKLDFCKEICIDRHSFGVNECQTEYPLWKKASCRKNEMLKMFLCKERCLKFHD